MSNEQNQQYSEQQIKLATKMNEKTGKEIGRLSMENVALAARNEILEEEKLILAQYVQQQDEKIKQYEGMLNIQEGEETESESELLKAVEAAKGNEDAGNITGGTINGADITGPNREQRRKKAKDEKG